MDKHITFDGPRHLHPSEEIEGRKLFALSFLDSVPDDSEVVANGNIDGWYVMVPESGPYRGKPISQIRTEHHEVRFGGGRLRIGSIGGVCTHPDFCGQGLAGQVLEHCAQQLKDEGARLMLISGGRGLYTRTGNVTAMRFQFFGLHSDQIQTVKASSSIRMRPAETGDAVVFTRLHQREPVHYLRQLAEYPDPGGLGRNWVVELGGSPAAFIMLMNPWDVPQNPDQGVREVMEYAGSRLAVAAGFSELVTGIQDPETNTPYSEIRVGVPIEDVELYTLLVAMGGQSSREPLLGHTMRLVNFPALRADLDVYIAARLPAALCEALRFEQTGPLLVSPDLGDQTGDRAGDRCAIVWNDSRLELSTAQMTQLVMGSWENYSDEASDQVEPPLDKIVDALFPLPSFLPGLNYR